jgi:hypothetical protein
LRAGNSEGAAHVREWMDARCDAVALRGFLNYKLLFKVLKL